MYRVISCTEHATGSSDLLVYDATGIVTSVRLTGIRDAHDVMPVEAGVLVASSIDNAVYIVHENGEVEPWWQADAPADAWHVNCLARDGDAIYASAFGRFTSHRAWSRDPLAPSGILMRLPEGRVVLDGLTQPHSPRRLDGTWVVCNSSAGEVAAYHDDGSVVLRRQLRGYTRGLAADDTYLYVGESAMRRDVDLIETAQVTILRRSDWSVVGSISVGATEVYDIVLAPRALEAGATAGFRTNPTRVQQEDQLALFAAAGVTPQRLWATGDRLPPESLRIAVEATFPERIAPNDVVSVACSITNRGNAIYVTAPPNPVHICYRWFDASGVVIGSGTWIHTPLPRALPPGETIHVNARVAAPSVAGHYTVALTLLQEGVAWFDDLDAQSGIRTQILVERSRD